MMSKVAICITCGSSVLWGFGCIAGGYFIRHDTIQFHPSRASSATLEITVNAGNAEKGFTWANMHCFIHGEKSSIKMERIDHSSKSVVFFTKVDRLNISREDEYVSYYFNFGNTKQSFRYPEKTFLYGRIETVE